MLIIPLFLKIVCARERKKDRTIFPRSQSEHLLGPQQRTAYFPSDRASFHCEAHIPRDSVAREERADRTSAGAGAGRTVHHAGNNLPEKITRRRQALVSVLRRGSVSAAHMQGARETWRRGCHVETKQANFILPFATATGAANEIPTRTVKPRLTQVLEDFPGGPVVKTPHFQCRG